MRQGDLASGALVWTALSGSNASQADLTRAPLLGAQLEAVDLSEVCLANATLRNASLRGSSLQGADLRGADLRGTRVTDTLLTSASVCYGSQRSDGAAAPCSAGRTCCGTDALIRPAVTPTAARAARLMPPTRSAARAPASCRGLASAVARLIRSAYPHHRISRRSWTTLRPMPQFCCVLAPGKDAPGFQRRDDHRVD